MPCTSTLSPALIPPWVISALQAVSAAQGSVAAASSLRCAGARDTPCSDSTIYSAMVPSSGAPSEVSNFSRLGSPEIQPWKKLGQTRSPSATRLTPSPTSTTSPMPSHNTIRGRLSVLRP